MSPADLPTHRLGRITDLTIPPSRRVSARTRQPEIDNTPPYFDQTALTTYVSLCVFLKDKMDTSKAAAVSAWASRSPNMPPVAEEDIADVDEPPDCTPVQAIPAPSMFQKTTLPPAGMGGMGPVGFSAAPPIDIL
ncbi:hypothetical protein IMZ48_15695 [Candidatus Bathyarchaeota archaeon]|nr:hypothetical protein [Candidatus Bathyarchaeota archaeon]